MPAKSALDPAAIVSDLRRYIEETEFTPVITSTGRIISAGDGVIVVDGLSEAKLGEIVKLPGSVFGLVLNLQDRQVSVVVLGEYSHLQVGQTVESTGRVLSVTASYSLLGRVVDPLMRPVDGLGPILADKKNQDMPVERIAPGVIERQDVHTPLQTGLKLIDALIPVGRGQRELIIGDRGIGKTAIALDAIINQSRLNKNLGPDEKRVISVYVAIGQKQSKVAQVMALLAAQDALSDTVIVEASAADSASLQYLAPFAATAVAEYFMQQGEDVLIVYDDLSKHAWAYRQLSLLLRRPSGREAYPGDIFYLHSRLLERAARMSDQLGGGSITALPIIETQAGDISAYIPTNVISITDGQIYLDPDLFYGGVRPAVSVGLSVSRVGGDAQIKAVKQVAGKLKLDLAQYRELAAFAQFGSDLDDATKKRLDRGKAITQLLKQNQYQPLPVEQQVASIWLGMQGYLDDVPVEKIPEFEETFLDRLSKLSPQTLSAIRTQKVLDEKLEKELAKQAEAVKQLMVS
jgi:F-type H+/Na+-transporting ATPase subunit alpha